MTGVTVSFVVDGREIVLPVTPSSYSWGASKDLNAVDMDSVGSVYLPGNKSAHKDSIQCLFPAQRYPFCAPGAVIDPQYYISLFTALAEQRKIVRYIVGNRVNAQVLIEEFKYQEQDGTGDVYGTIWIAEYTDLAAVTTQTTAVRSDTGNYARTTEPEVTAVQTYTVVKGDCLSVICRRFYGNGGPAWYNALAKYNGIKNPNLIFPGQILTIPPAEQMGVST